MSNLNVYAVIHPQTNMLIGFTKSPIVVDKPELVEFFSISTVTNETHKLLNVILSNDPEFIAEYNEDKYCDLDIKNETSYWIVFEGQNVPVLRDTTTLRKLKKAMSNLKVPAETKDLLISLATLQKSSKPSFDNFILKSMKLKPIEKIKEGDVVIYNDELYHISETHDDAVFANRIISLDTVECSHKVITDKLLFRVGRF